MYLLDTNIIVEFILGRRWSGRSPLDKDVLV